MATARSTSRAHGGAQQECNSRRQSMYAALGLAIMLACVHWVAAKPGMDQDLTPRSPSPPRAPRPPPAPPAPNAQLCPNRGLDSLDELIKDVKDSNTWLSPPTGAMAAVVRYDPWFQGYYLRAQGAWGKRNWNKDWLLDTLDQGRIGSCSKSFTAALVAMLVEQGKFSFDSKIKDLVPSGWTMNAQYTGATVRHVMGHAAGFPRDYTPSLDGTFVQNRKSAAKGLLQQAPIAPLGKMVYSNAGYIFLGFLVDTYSSDGPWEVIVKKYIWDKLDLDSAGLYEIGDNGDNVPYGHNERCCGVGKDNTYDPVWGSTKKWQAPAGDIHMRAADHATWAAWNLMQETVAPNACPKPWKAPCLSKASVNVLHHSQFKATGSNYASGWVEIGNNGWSGSAAFWHNGALLGWYSEMFAMPAYNMAVSIITNHYRTNQTDGKGMPPGDWVYKIGQALVDKYKVPGCGSLVSADGTSLIGYRVQLHGSCMHTSSFAGAKRCYAVTGQAVAYRATPTPIAASACSQACVTDPKCIAWAFTPGPDAGTTGCTLLKLPTPLVVVGGITSNRGRRLQQRYSASGIDDIVTGPVVCVTDARYTSGQIVRTDMTNPILATSFGNTAPYNNAGNGAPCTDSAELCAQHCERDQQGTIKCSGYTWNASTKKCFLFSGSLSVTPWPFGPHCGLYTATRKSC